MDLWKKLSHSRSHSKSSHRRLPNRTKQAEKLTASEFPSTKDDLQQMSGILRLPMEILEQILNECRQNGFESLMLSCKRIYSNHYYLIEGHNYCRHWERDNPKPTYDFGDDRNYVELMYPIKYFQRILEAPRFARPYLVNYASNASVRMAPACRDFKLETMRKLRTEVSVVQKQMLRIMENCPALLECVTASKIKACLQGHEFEVLESVEMNDVNACYAILVLFLLPELRILKLSNDSWYPDGVSCAQLLPQLVQDDLGQTNFQQLETLLLTNLNSVGMPYFASFLMLPNLKVLKVHRDRLHRHSEESGPYNWPSSNTKSSRLLQLVLQPIVLSPEELSQILSRIEKLESLVLDFLADIASFPTPSNVQTIDYQAGLETVQSNWIDDVVSRKNNQIYQPREYPPLRAVDYLKLIAIGQKFLKHLAISFGKQHTYPLMESDQFIVDFKDFKELTHLEVEWLLLRPSDWSLKRSKITYLPHPLVSYLPSSIEVVRLIFGDSHDLDERTCNALFAGLADDARQCLPKLRKIHLRLSGMTVLYDRNMARYRPDLEVWNKMLGRIGIELVWEAIADDISTGTCLETYSD